MVDQHEKNFQQVTRDGESHMIEQNFLSSPGNITLNIKKNLLTLLLIILLLGG